MQLPYHVAYTKKSTVRIDEVRLTYPSELQRVEGRNITTNTSWRRIKTSSWRSEAILFTIYSTISCSRSWSLQLQQFWCWGIWRLSYRTWLDTSMLVLCSEWIMVRCLLSLPDWRYFCLHALSGRLRSRSSVRLRAEMISVVNLAQFADLCTTVTPDTRKAANNERYRVFEDRKESKEINCCSGRL